MFTSLLQVEGAWGEKTKVSKKAEGPEGPFSFNHSFGNIIIETLGHSAEQQKNVLKDLGASKNMFTSALKMFIKQKNQ